MRAEEWTPSFLIESAQIENRPRNPPLGVSIKRSIVSDRESSQVRFNGAPITRDNWITFRLVRNTRLD